MTRKIVHYPDPILRKKARPVPSVTDEVRQLIDEMIEAMRAASGVGLAAPQVGVSQRVIVWDVGDGAGALVNPKIIRTAGSQVGPEGCLSLPGLQGTVQRPERVVVRGLDRDGNEVRISGEGLLARCLCHEIDHLDGRLFIDVAEEGSLHWLGAAETEDVLGEELAERVAETPEEELPARPEPAGRAG